MLALSTGLFDTVPLEKMNAAERAVRASAATFPPDLSARLVGAGKMSDADRDALVKVAHMVLADFSAGALPQSGPQLSSASPAPVQVPCIEKLIKPSLTGATNEK